MKRNDLVVLALLAATLSACGSETNPAISSGNPKKDAIGLYREVVRATSACDVATSSLGAALQGTDLVEAYRVAERAEGACLGTPTDIRQIGIPESLKGESLKSAKKAIEACDSAYVAKWAAARVFKKIIDGDSSPSALSEAKSLTEQISASSFLCSGGLVAAAVREGATEAELGIEPKKAEENR